ncbi:beta-1,3-galactosyltransferase 1-like [Mya arenaria]|uniref:beta-1,3-galactosyltransferase 1-like n=1 Tax=Mya arenaria TaxID=6604 RepID=UPI0022E46E78|nr:beta-1,3-galactosyltransferase 1-like [Mya arenaria]
MPECTHLTTTRTAFVVMFIVGVSTILVLRYSNLDSLNFKLNGNDVHGTDMAFRSTNIDLHFIESRITIDDFGNIKYSSKNKRKGNCHKCFLHEFKYVIDNPNICNEDRGETARIFIFVFTEHSNIDRRTAIRKTWLSLSNNNTSEVRYAFVLGETEDKHLRDAVLKENEIYHDIIKENFKDSYRNLTYKTILGLKWVTEKCPSVQFIMKTDDDVFLNIKSLMLMLNSSNDLGQNDAIIGDCHIIADPIRDKHSKWYASVYSYPDRFYPGFCSGTGYVMSSSVAKALYKISPNVPFFHLEDVYIAMCMKTLGYRLVPTSGFVVNHKANVCEYKYMDVVTVHNISPKEMEEIWNSHC